MIYSKIIKGIWDTGTPFQGLEVMTLTLRFGGSVLCAIHLHAMVNNLQRENG